MKERTPTDAQRRLASALGVSLGDDCESVAAARLFDSVASAVGEKAPRPVTDRQVELAVSLGLDVSGDTTRVASARIAEKLHAKHLSDLRALGLKVGDRVVQRLEADVAGKHHVYLDEFVVSSIQPNGRILFKGGNGRGAWPHEVTRVG